MGRGRGVVAAVCAVALTACGVAPARQARVATPTPAAAGVPTTTSTTAPFTTYVVAKGDSLSAIATRFGTSVQAIASANHLTNLGTLAVGEVLRLPVDTSLGLSVSPHDGQPGSSFELVLTRANPSDLVTFSIAQPGHKPYTGPQHTPTPDGTVKATYQTYPGDPPGTYLVLAHTSSGKGAFTSFRVGPPSPSSSS